MPTYPALFLRVFAAATVLMMLAACARSDAEGRVRSLADDVEIAWSSRGKGPVTLVFVHGWQCDADYWRDQLDAFAPDYRIITLDLAGHGASGDEREDWSMTAFGGDVAAVVEQVAGDGPAVLIGHSMGGPVILEAARQSNRITGLIAVDTLRDVGGPAAEADIQAQLAPLRADYATIVAGFIDGMFVESTPETLRTGIRTDMLAGDRQIGLAMMAEYSRMDYPATLGELDVPLVVINADYLPPGIDSLQALYPRAQLMPIEGTGHFPMLEAPARFNEVLGDALETVLTQAASR